MRCVLDEDKILGRAQEVARLLRRIAPPAQRIACRPRWLDRHIVLCAYVGAEPTDPNPDEWRFPTRIPEVRACYYERWLPTDFRRIKLYLDQAYLHLFVRGDHRSEKQILALHCDPNEAESSRHFRYKAGPHVHMSTAQDPLHRAHIALNIDNLDEILRSVPKVTTAFDAALTMVNDQVLGLY